LQQHITIAKERFNLADLLDSGACWEGFSDYEKSALSFLQGWNSNRKRFAISTSGSTGQPKIITLSREKLELSARKTIKHFNLSSQDVAFVCLDIGYIGGLMMLVRSMLAGMDMIVAPPAENPILRTSENERPHYIGVVPVQLQSLLDQSDNPILSEVKVIVVGGGQLNAALRKQCSNSKISIYHSFGMTETVSHIAMAKLSASTGNRFKILPHVEIKVDSRNRLMIKSDVTAEKWITTNDVVKIYDKTHFEWRGRIDNVINSGGVKITPELFEPEICNLLNGLRLGGRLFMAGVPDSKLGNRAVLMYEGKLGGNRRSDVIQELKQLLPKYHDPKDIWCVDKFLETPTGKIRRKETIEDYLNK